MTRYFFLTWEHILIPLSLRLMLTMEEGIKAVELARNAINSHVKSEEISLMVLGKKFDEKLGVFVTINTYPKKELRGCIGIPEPIKKLKDAIIDSARSATRDPRFSPLTIKELDEIIVEVTILTKPKPIEVKKPREYPTNIEIGKDGLIIEKGWQKGLLLPQVPVEWKWNKEEFLSHLCMKAGLPPDSWFEKDAKIYKFQGQIFAENNPNGGIEERKMND